jgi:PhnB protein
MTITTTAHLNFRGNAREALGFYGSVFGGQPVIVTHAQAYGTTDPAETELVSWGQVESPAGFRVMAFDVPAAREYEPGIIPFFVSIRGTDADEISAYWSKLIEGGIVVAPLAASAWSPLYGMVEDRFGVTWVIDVEVPWNA